MYIKTAVSEAFKEVLLPKIREIRHLVKEMTADQLIVNRRIDDIIDHYKDNRSRIYQASNEIDKEMKTIDKRIDSLNHTLGTRIDFINKRIDRLYDLVIRREKPDELRKHLHAFNRRLKRVEEKVGVV